MNETPLSIYAMAVQEDAKIVLPILAHLKEQYSADCQSHLRNPSLPPSPRGNTSITDIFRSKMQQTDKNVKLCFLSPSLMSDPCGLMMLLANQYGSGDKKNFVPIIVEDIPLADGSAYDAVMKSFGSRDVPTPKGMVSDRIEESELPSWYARGMEAYYKTFTSLHSADYPNACAKTVSHWEYYFERSENYGEKHFFRSLCYQIFREILNAERMTLLDFRYYLEDGGISEEFYQDILTLIENPHSKNVRTMQSMISATTTVCSGVPTALLEGGDKKEFPPVGELPSLMNHNSSYAFYYVLCQKDSAPFEVANMDTKAGSNHSTPKGTTVNKNFFAQKGSMEKLAALGQERARAMKEQTLPSEEKLQVQTILHTLETEYHLDYYNPHALNSAQKHFSRDKQLNLLKTKENNPFKKMQDYILPSNATAVFCFLSTAVMTSIECLEQLLASQISGDCPVDVVAFMEEDVPLQEGEKYQAFLKALPDEGEYKFTPTFIVLLKKMYKRLAHSSITGSYPNSCPETLKTWSSFVTADSNNRGLFTRKHCYCVFKEVINSLNCNYIYVEHYEKDKEIMPLFYSDLVTRLENSIPRGISAFSAVKNISPKQEKYYFKDSLENTLNTEAYYGIAAEECVTDGDRLVSCSSSHAKMKLSFSLSSMEANALNGNHTLEEILLPEGLITIGDNAFQYCTNLRKIHFPSTLEKIGANAFNGCVSLDHVVLPESVYEIGSGAFSHCVSLSSVELPESLQQLNDSTFSDCSKLASIKLKSVKILMESVFAHCYDLSSVEFGENLLYIGDSCFDSCAMKELSFPASLEHLGNFAFAHCGSLARAGFTMSIGSIAEVGTAPFLDCPLFTELTLAEHSLWQQILLTE